MLKNYFTEEKYEEIKESNDLLYKAYEISTIFLDDIDKGGNSYVEHMLYCYKNVDTKDEKIVALLHDILENKDVSESDLKEVGFTDKIINDIKILTRVKPIEYKDYITSIIENGSKEALVVKLVAIKHSMDLKRIKNPKIKDYERVEKRYTPAYNRILNKLEEME